jgi:hypothetical protein
MTNRPETMSIFKDLQSQEQRNPCQPASPIFIKLRHPDRCGGNIAPLFRAVSAGRRLLSGHACAGSGAR